MGSVLFVSPGATIPGALSLLNHATSAVATTPEAIARMDAADVLVVDGRDDLVWARAVTTTLRAARADVAIMLLVPPNGVSLLGREWGFTDFVTDTSEPAEFDARIRMLMRSATDRQVLAFGPIRVDEAAYLATLSGDPLDLTYTEFELLRYLMANPGKVLTREVLLSQVWGYDYFGGTRTVDVHIRRLRAKLGQFDWYIGTVRNVGYRFTSARKGSE
ncbi:winged helix-turn-helix transcriptional regulator [Tessaracoccus antarcticus]|uniref:DNA-binding response regulator n=1 Tax=Tessaracoccus antarcticus TaxID=2479848 RepID=A0A3M0GUX8_9ACTN|nr:response regulator transcription factor [Tessaracoccus antarcticus]RMB61126.1 DNA-binding response regulator [Tessaracoccus antarcticus]